MKETLVAKCTISIRANPSKVWEALVTPALVKQYLFGANVISTWQEGSSITYRGIWEGIHYEDRGHILTLIPEEVLETAYIIEKPPGEGKTENFHRLRYLLEPTEDGAKLTITQDNLRKENDRDNAQQNWNTVLHILKDMLENELTVF